MKSYVTNQLNFRRKLIKSAHNEHAVLLLKPGFVPKYIAYTETYLKKHNINIEWKERVLLSSQDILVIYNDIFRFNNNDLTFGFAWKKRKLEYMQTGPCLIYVVKGIKAQAICEKLKYDLREKYEKLSIPRNKLNEKDFDSLVTKNIIHVVDSNETEVTLWLIEQIQLRELSPSSPQ